MAALQIKRMVEAENIEETYDVSSIGEMCQFASTLIVLQGIDDIPQAHKDVLVPFFNAGRLAIGELLRVKQLAGCMGL